MKSNGLPAEKDLPFKLGDVVLVRYSAYPYWPATVDETHQKSLKGKFYRKMRTRSGKETLAFWCTFANEDTGGWVRHDRMAMFHPDLLTLVRVSKTNEWYEDQKYAISSAEKSFRLVHRTTLPKAPIPPADMKAQKHRTPGEPEDDEEELVSDDAADLAADEADEEDDPMDLGDSSADERVKQPKSSEKRRRSGRQSSLTSKSSRKSPARPKPKKEPHKSSKRKSGPSMESPRPKKRGKAEKKLEEELLKDLDDDSEEPRKRVREEEDEDVIDSTKRRRSTHKTEPPKKHRKLEAELENANQTIAKLKKTLRRRDKQIAELTGSEDGVGIVCVVPRRELRQTADIPDRQMFRTVQFDSNKFHGAMDKLSKDFKELQAALDASKTERKHLEETIADIKPRYKKAVDKLIEAERDASAKESIVIGDLHEILLADVAVQDLREHKAGQSVRNMQKQIKDVPSVWSLCKAIYESWKHQVFDFVKENKDKVGHGSPSGSKESPESKAGAKDKDSTSHKVEKDTPDKVKKASAGEAKPVETGGKDSAKAGKVSERDGREAQERETEMKDLASEDANVKYGDEKPKPSSKGGKSAVKMEDATDWEAMTSTQSAAREHSSGRKAAKEPQSTMAPERKGQGLETSTLAEKGGKTLTKEGNKRSEVGDAGLREQERPYPSNETDGTANADIKDTTAKDAGVAKEELPTKSGDTKQEPKDRPRV